MAIRIKPKVITMKMFRVLGVGLVVMCGCSRVQKLPAVAQKVHIEGASVTHTIRKFEFEGHKYLFMDGYRQSGLVHDPNCECYAR